MNQNGVANLIIEEPDHCEAVSEKEHVREAKLFCYTTIATVFLGCNAYYIDIQDFSPKEDSDRPSVNESLKLDSYSIDDISNPFGKRRIASPFPWSNP
ncbi:hypothetical protein M514_05115 [Trichuris suis]|uniref:Uncharacterized protein n=1 Tax=Trichuris suis TaxID=68888 RepID=A0A085N0M1_9BILA|nr:hypothetical protein M513_05115 [Trichuris suis]KFD63017.1 hypothetical protein M514_05115 [Trichuris suis]